MRSTPALFFPLSLALALGGCFGAHDDGAPDAGAAPGSDGGGATPIADAGAVPPGDGGAPGCAAQDAAGVGGCRLLLGWIFDGAACVALSGCECTGSDCDALYASQEACAAACLAPPPGPCDAQRVRGVGACRIVAGWAWDGASCVIVGCSCEGPDCDDIFESPGACEAAYASCAGDACAPDVATVPQPPTCRPGAERAYYTAEGCVQGCPCTEGTGAFGWPAECPPSYASVADCDAAHAACPAACDPMDAAGEGPCEAILGVRWTGTRCETLSGCTCVGADCGALFATPAECADAFEGCAGGRSCDRSEVRCRMLPPRCPEGEVPEVVDACWGECVPFEECAPIACRGIGGCPVGTSCRGGLCAR